MLKRDRLGSVKSAAVKIHHRDSAGPRIGVHAGRHVVPAKWERFRIGHLDFDGIAGELRSGADEFEGTCLAHRTSATIATDEPASAKSLPTCANGHLFA